MGKTKDAINCRLYKWEFKYLDKRTEEIITAKFCSITDLNRKLNMEVKNEDVYREIKRQKNKFDEYAKLGRNFLKQNLKLLEINKIHEIIDVNKKNDKETDDEEKENKIIYV